MALHIITRAIVKSSKLPLRTIQSMKNYSLYTPDYLETMKPKIPLCPVVNVQIKGYSYPILEKYQKLVDTIATRMDIDVDNSWAVPATRFKIDRYKPFSTTIDIEYKLDLYERNIQLSNISSTYLPIFIRLLEASAPEGVILNIEVWDPEKENIRYVPDKQLLDLKGELDVMLAPKK